MEKLNFFCLAFICFIVNVVVLLANLFVHRITFYFNFQIRVWRGLFELIFIPCQADSVSMRVSAVYLFLFHNPIA